MFFIQRFQLAAILPNLLTFYFCKFTVTIIKSIQHFFILLDCFYLHLHFFSFFFFFFGFFFCLLLLFAGRFLFLIPYKTDLNLISNLTFIILHATMPLFNGNLRKRKQALDCHNARKIWEKIQITTILLNKYIHMLSNLLALKELIPIALNTTQYIVKSTHIQNKFTGYLLVHHLRLRFFCCHKSQLHLTYILSLTAFGVSVSF